MAKRERDARERKNRNMSLIFDKSNVNTNTEEMLNFIVPFESELENVD